MNITYKKCTATTAAAIAGMILSEYLSLHREKEILFLVSGGSAFDVLAHIDCSLVGRHVTMNVIDERFDVEKEDQNFYQLSQLPFARDFIAVGGKLCDVQMNEASDVQHAGALLAGCIQDFMIHSPTGKIVTLLGMGSDGHTVGVMPHPAEEKYFTQTFVDTHHSAVGYDAIDKNPLPLRATVTLSFLQKHVNYAVLYVVGDEKAEALTVVHDAQGTLHKTPARIVREMQDVVLCSDQVWKDS